jgi:hypothetical protein
MLLQYPVKFPSDIDPDEKTMEIRAANAHVPAQRTTYWCAIVELDKDLQDAKHHVVKLEPIITPGMEQIVHHMEVFHCITDEDATEEYNGDCQSKERPKMSHMCSKVLAAWSMGASTVFYPKEAGLHLVVQVFVHLLWLKFIIIIQLKLLDWLIIRASDLHILQIFVQMMLVSLNLVLYILMQIQSLQDKKVFLLPDTVLQIVQKSYLKMV